MHCRTSNVPLNENIILTRVISPVAGKPGAFGLGNSTGGTPGRDGLPGPRGPPGQPVRSQLL